jgi:RNA polymerase sigma-70 factor (ECF subfamily)
VARELPHPETLLRQRQIGARSAPEPAGNLLLPKASNKTGEAASLDQISDSECVRRIHEGNVDAFEVLVRRHQKTIFNLLYRMLGDYDEAAEAAQETFLSAYRAIGRFRGDANFSTWVYRIAINQASSRRRNLSQSQARTLPLESAERVNETGADPAERVEQKEIQQQVRKALTELDANDAAIILLRDLQDVPYEEVARVLNVPMGTVKSRLHRARRALKVRLQPYFNARRTRK